MRKGEIISREVLMEGTNARQPGTARFHVTENGHLFALLYAVIDGTPGNYIMPIKPALGEPELIPAQPEGLGIRISIYPPV